MEIPATSIQRLRERGLFVAEPLPPGYIYPGGVLIGKPVDVQGHAIADYRTSYGDVDGSFNVEFDAPLLWLYPHSGRWVVLSQDYCGGEGPGDFINDWDSIDDAVDDVVDFFFGDPHRIGLKAKGLQPKKR